MSIPRPTTRAICVTTACALVVLLLTSVARLYHPVYGFTALIGFVEDNPNELPALQAIPHAQHPPWATYDGQFYAQLALEPLLKDPAIDRALDNPPYRTRRILFSWTAWALGLGRPAWVLHAYSIQNVLFWLMLAAVMTRWLAPTTPRGLALWTACMFSHGLLTSMRHALLDGPSMLLIALAIAASERGRLFLSAAVLGIAGLGRETNLLAAMGLPWLKSRRWWLSIPIALVLVALPLLLWQDYLRSIYRSMAFVGQNQLDRPVLVYLEMFRRTAADAFRPDAGILPLLKLGVITSLTAQTAYLFYRRDYASPWWRVSVMFALLMLTVHKVVWDGYPGAVTRVTLPLAFGFNVLLARDPGRGFWLWYAIGNLQLLAGAYMIPF